MKKLSSRMKIMLVLSICAAFIVPSVASARSLSTELVPNADNEKGVFAKGHYTLKGLPLHKGQTIRVDFKVVNGDGMGNDVVSSVKITLLDEKGNPKEVVISPSDFSQKKDKSVEFSTVNGYFLANSVKDMDNFSLDIKVGGPKNSSITLTVTEYYGGFVQRF